MPTKNIKIKKYEGRSVDLYIVLHVESSDGFHPGCSVHLRSSNNDRDYHKTMDSILFKHWVMSSLKIIVKYRVVRNY